MPIILQKVYHSQFIGLGPPGVNNTLQALGKCFSTPSSLEYNVYSVIMAKSKFMAVLSANDGGTLLWTVRRKHGVQYLIRRKDKLTHKIILLSMRAKILAQCSNKHPFPCFSFPFETEVLEILMNSCGVCKLHTLQN